MRDGAGLPLVSRRAVWVAAAGFWLFAAAVSAAQLGWMAQRPGQGMNLEAVAWQTSYFVAWIPFTIGVWHITWGWLPDRFGGWLRLLIAHAPVFAAVVVGHAVLVTLLSLALSHQNMSMWESFVRQLSGQVTGDVLIYTAIAGVGAAITLDERYRDRQVAASRLQAELASARLQALRRHLQPHFLFNSLHSIAGLARTGDTAGVVRMIAALSDLLRYVLDAEDRHASLREE